MSMTEPDYDAIVRSGVLPTFDTRGGAAQVPPIPVPFDRGHLDELYSEYDAAVGRWLDWSVPEGSRESMALYAEVCRRSRTFTAAFLASVPTGDRLVFVGADGRRHEQWHHGDGKIQYRRVTEGATP